jgi:hypothetical protein
MHYVDSFVSFIESSSHNFGLIAIFFRLHCFMSMVPSFFICVKQCPEEALTYILLDVHHIN